MWIVNDEAAAVVRRIFNLRRKANGKQWEYEDRIKNREATANGGQESGSPSQGYSQ